MSRKTEVAGPELEGDPVFESTLVERLINSILQEGKKSLAERVVYSAFLEIERKTGDNPLDVFVEALRNVAPEVEVRPRRVGGATYQVPLEVPVHRHLTLGIRWLVYAARNRSERRMYQRLASELIDASNSEGAAVRRRVEIYRMAEANKAYAHYRW